MKICMIVHQDYYLDSRVRRYAEALLETGVEVDVLCLRGRTQGTGSNPPGLRVMPCPIAHTAETHFSLLCEYMFAFLWFSFRLIGLLCRNRYDVVHVHNMPDFLVFAAAPAKLFGSKIILDLHDPMPEFYVTKHPGRLEMILVPLLRLQEQLSCRFADEVITANPNFKTNVVSRGTPAQKVTVVLNVPNPMVFRRRAAPTNDHDQSTFTIMYIGTVAPRYGLDIAIRAMPAILREVPQARLLVLGHLRGMEGELMGLAKSLAVAEHVCLRTAVQQDALVEEMQRADAAIYTAYSSPVMEITLPTKLLEYAAVGLPIVSTSFQVLRTLFGDSAMLLFETGKAEQFAECVVRLYRSPELRKQLVCNMDEIFMRKYPFSAERDAYFGVLSALLPSLAWQLQAREKPAARTDRVRESIAV